MFRKVGYDVFLLDEHKTSKVCPHCYEEVETFKMRRNPKPYKNNQVALHGLLRCQSNYCQQQCGFPARLWNRDDVATLNQLYIVQQLLTGNDRPAPFQRHMN